MSKTRIVILQMKEIIYTAIFIGLGLLLVLLLLIMFRPGKEASAPEAISTSEAIYAPGVYTTQLKLGSATVNLEVLLDANHINAVQITTLDETISTMYPLLQPTIEDISSQLSNGAALENVVLSSESQYTQTVILRAIDKTLQKAKKH